ncbi:metal ABC transporter ATP-binding protein [Patescibacteria group bacterium]
MIKVKDLIVKFQDNLVLNKISFEIKKGELVVIVGPNGSGKSVLLKTILGLIKKTSGEIEVNTEKIGYVPQRLSIDQKFPLTVHEFLTLKSHNHKETMRVLRLVKGGKWHKKNLGSLSGGQLQRVLLAYSLIGDPELLILDEPLSGVDISTGDSLFHLLEHLHKEHHLTTLIVSHDMEVVNQFASRVICLNQRLVCDGIPRKVLTGETIEKLYGSHAGHFKHKH